jgi:hypothetical protein
LIHNYSGYQFEFAFENEFDFQKVL